MNISSGYRLEGMVSVDCADTFYHGGHSPLLPLMHWPTFSQHLISRRDRHDELFRIFLMSLSMFR